MENVAARESSRGRRKHGGLLEECVGIDQNILQSVLIPMMNISRRVQGEVDPNEVTNQSQVYITTAGDRNTYSYQKLIQTMVQMITEPGKAYIMGGTYRIPVVTGLLPQSFLQDLKRDPTFNEAAFEREYCSHWAGSSEDSFYSGEVFDRNRILQKPEYEASGKSNDHTFYLISADVGRKNDATVAAVFKITPQPQGAFSKHIVNIVSFDNMHFEDQAIALKKLYYKYNARRLVIDGNGLGIGLVDYMVKAQTDKFGDNLPPFGVYNDSDGEYKQYHTEDTEDDAMYIIKANAVINSAAYVALQQQMASGKIKFLIESRAAKAKLLGTKLGQTMSPEQRSEYLIPYTLTDILKDELLNLRENTDGAYIQLKRANRRIHKDKVSALAYGIYYTREEEETRKRRKKFNVTDMMFFTS